MTGVRDRAVFAIGARTYAWQDVVAAARAWGDWAQIEQAAQEGLACERRALERESPVTQAAVDAAARAFRERRDLLAAEDMQRWLAEWEIGVRDWLDFVRRDLLRRTWAGELPPPTDASRQVIWTQAVCDGALERLAYKLAQRAAAQRRITGVDPGDDFAAMEACFGTLCERAVTHDAIAEQLAANRVEWLRADVRRLVLHSREAANEAALCVRVDGMELGAVAAAIGEPVEELRLYLDRAPGELRPHLLSAVAGDLIGPLASGDEFWLVHVLDKRAPSEEDREIRARAEERLKRRAAESAVLSEVTWCERLQD